MKIAVIGGEYELNYIADVIAEPHRIAKTILWSEQYGPEILDEENLWELEEFTYIIVAVKEDSAADAIVKILENVLPDAERRLLNFYKMYSYMLPWMVADRRMQHPEIDHYEGMILGISHAEVGILSRCFEIPFCNLAVSSQDIYYQLKTFEYCVSKYREKICNLKYVVLEMFDYTYFNYDVSLSSRAEYYYSIGGYRLDGHNYERKKGVNWPFEVLIDYLEAKRARGISQEVIDAWRRFFPNIYEQDHYSSYENYRNINERMRMVDEEDVDDFVVETSIVRNLYENTVKENIESFYKLLKEIYQLNPDMKVFVLLIPRYSEAQKKAESAYAKWKSMFYEIIGQAYKEYPFRMLDMKNSEISENRMFYQDVSHLNYYGAYQFTKVLKRYLFAGQKTDADVNVSIILSAYHGEKDIGRAVRSVLNQTYPHFELIIVDDDPTDHTREVIRQFHDKRIRYIKSTADYGAAHAKNIGIREAKYDYLAFLDSGAVWLPDKLEKQMAYMLSVSDEVGMSYCRIGGQESAAEERFLYLDITVTIIALEEKIFQQLIYENVIGISAVLVRWECFEKVGCFKEELNYGADWELFLRIGKEYRIGFVDEQLVETEEKPDLVGSNAVDTVVTKCYLISLYKTWMKEMGVLDKIAEDVLNTSVSGGFYKEGLALLRKAMLGEFVL